MTQTTIRLTNTKTRKKEDFIPIDAQNVRMYVCGPTVYDRAHIGNARPVIVFDVLYRLLRHVYGENHVTYVRNFTDVDDKINAKAAETGRSIREITDETSQWYLDDMQAVGAMNPDHMPRATEYIDQMITMIQDLIEKGHAYPDGAGHVLFSVNSYAQYGALSGRNTDDMIAGARVEVADNKRDPMDFVLWKPSDADTPGWDSPWGKGRPGWHIECSAMAKDILGDHFDIHGGGNDLMFPHHENEIAQSCCASGHADDGEGFANYWLHNEMLQVEGKKMSKSLGNFFTVRDLLDQGVPGEVVRFVFLSTHYRKPMDWTAEKAEQAKKELTKWRRLVAGIQPTEVDLGVAFNLSQDLNTPAAIASLRAIANDIIHIEKFEKAGMTDQLTHSSNHWRGILKASATLLGLLTDELSGWESAVDGNVEVLLTPIKSRLSTERMAAMVSKDFSEVDRIKTALLDAGVEVRMSKTGVELEAGPKFDPSKLEGLL
ncbi:cysteinyl-tRNA synthetase [Pacificibacter maritimus]|uniref:Cysteine--tRNA ligase n=1 Tax=Pacificibacter maritimus TaxID=762213 RepID=A0A3N4UVQ7_9RHOB|nr:cysteine--tRNA ligase [Pacificibacter maritimus]RPE71579.1 cysteinyl-tRNA synthetase [Pacificibacter maritimus]